MPPVTGKRSVLPAATSVRFPADDEPVVVHEGDCLAAMVMLPSASVDAVVTDPPYGLEFMGREWDHGVPGVPFWERALRALKPGGYMLAFGGTRTYHQLACAVEDAGFEVRDCLMWMYGTGWPKGKGCLKPAWEPILLARRPGPRVLPLQIEECRIGTETVKTNGWKCGGEAVYGGGVGFQADGFRGEKHAGRWPANVLHDGSDEVLEAFAAFGERTTNPGTMRTDSGEGGYGTLPPRPRGTVLSSGDSGSVARFFYTAKASQSEREAAADGTKHPTQKPLELMRWLVRLVARHGELVLDPFAGSGTTGRACGMEGRRCILVEREPAYAEIARALARGFRSAPPPTPVTGLGRAVEVRRGSAP